METVTTPATTTEAGSTTSAEPTKPVDIFAEAFESAAQQLSGNDGAAEAVTSTDTTTETAADPAEPPAADVATSETAATTDSAAAGEYTPEEIQTLLSTKPGAFLHLDLQRVPKQLRGLVAATRSALGEKYKAEARASRDDSNQPPAETTTEDEALTKEQLYDLALEGPEGFDKAMRAWARQNMPNVLKENGLDPSKAVILERQAAAETLDAAIDAASEHFDDLAADTEFRKAVGVQLKADPAMKAELDEATKNGDVKTATIVLELMAGRASAALAKAAAVKPPAAPAAKPAVATTTSKATQAARDLTATAASRSTTKGAQPTGGKMTPGRAWDEAVAQATK